MLRKGLPKLLPLKLDFGDGFEQRADPDKGGSLSVQEHIELRGGSGPGDCAGPCTIDRQAPDAQHR